MKPISAALNISHWLMRGSILIYLILVYLDKIMVVNFKSFQDVMYFVYVLTAVLLFIGGFMSKQTLTILAGIAMFLCTLYFMGIYFPNEFTKAQFMSLLIYTWPAGIGLYFAGSGG